MSSFLSLAQTTSTDDKATTNRMQAHTSSPIDQVRASQVWHNSLVFIDVRVVVLLYGILVEFVSSGLGFSVVVVMLQKLRVLNVPFLVPAHFGKNVRILDF